MTADDSTNNSSTTNDIPTNDENSTVPEYAIGYRPKYHGGRLRFAISCSSNMNRSMEAHVQLMNMGFNVESFGSGTAVKLPGPTQDRPNIYEFDGMTYANIRLDLIRKNKDLYVRNGLIAMLDRNVKVKEKPQKFQKCEEEFDVIICLEERVYDQINEFLHKRPSRSGHLVHLINIDIKDTHNEAVFGARVVCQLAQKLEASKDLDDEIDDILVNLDSENQDRNFLHAIHFY